MSVVIVITGGIVRVTGSGLGCPTWPRCESDSLATTPELGVHGLIEFGNRMLTGALSTLVLVLIVVVALQRVPAPRLIARAGWAQLALVVVNAVVGGITVLTRLSPWMVALHFLAAMGLLTTTTITWHRVREYTRPDQAADTPAPSTERRLALACLASTVVTIVLGTLATGTGPHAGDSADIERMPFNWLAMTLIHAAAVAATCVLAGLLAVRLHRADPRGIGSMRAQLFLGALGFQALVGIIQSTTALPSWLVVVHLFGACLVWAGAVRLILDTTSPLNAVEPSR